jgi:ubiquinone/menaquinone biosynthesis C-methylase UbiE
MADGLATTFGTAETSHLLVSNVDFPFKNSFFDTVVSADFIEHTTYEEKDQLLKEIYRVLKKEGTAIIFTPNGIREKIGEICWRFRRFIFRDNMPSTDLHFGLTNKFQFEPLLRKHKFQFALMYSDITRPYLVKIPVIGKFLCLNLLWILKRG